jgi:predicted enzyme related to lactoylglutathione lyase
MRNPSFASISGSHGAYNPVMPHIEKSAPGAFCWIELATTDQNGAKAFYSSLFNWEAADMPMGPGEVYTIFNVQGSAAAAAYTMREEQRSQGIPPHWLPYIATASADNTANKASLLGGNVLAQPFDVFDLGRMAVLQDPAGAVFAAWEAKKNQGLSIAGEPNTYCWADLSTPDVDAAKRFYEGLLGWKIAPSENDASGYLHIDNGGTMIGGVPPSKMRDPKVPPHWMLYFMVTDCDAATSKAKDLGARVYMPPMTIEKVGRMSVVADPQGAAFATFQPAMERK